MKARSKFFIISGLLLMLLLPDAADAAATSLTDAVAEARVAAISEATLNRLLTLGYQKQIDSSVMARLLLVLTQVRRERVPLEPFVAKLEEGLAKNVAGPVIEKVMLERLDQYRFTRALIEQSQTRSQFDSGLVDESWVRFTESSYCGLTRQDLERVLHHDPQASLAMVARAAELLATLKQFHWDANLADQIVATAVKEKYLSRERGDFMRALGAARAKGLSDRTITDAALATMAAAETGLGLADRLGISSGELGAQGPGLGASGPEAAAGNQDQGSGAGGAAGGAGAGSSGSGAGSGSADGSSGGGAGSGGSGGSGSGSGGSGGSAGAGSSGSGGSGGGGAGAGGSGGKP